LYAIGKLTFFALDVWSRDPQKEEQFRSSPTLFTGKCRKISIFFSSQPTSPSLSAVVQAYRWNDERDDGKVEKAAFVRDLIPSHQTLMRWIEEQIQYESKTDFPSTLQRFLMIYSQEGVGLPRVSCEPGPRAGREVLTRYSILS
jgi:hypothetical protein